MVDRLPNPTNSDGFDPKESGYINQLIRILRKTLNDLSLDSNNLTSIITFSNTNKGSIAWYSGSGSPNGVVTANVGSLYTNAAGGSGTTLYVKESGINTNTGWIGK